VAKASSLPAAVWRCPLGARPTGAGCRGLPKPVGALTLRKPGPKTGTG